MGRLHCIVLLTPEIERQKAFYEQKLGLRVAHASPEWVSFALRGASLVLRPSAPGDGPELRLALTAQPLEPRIDVLKAKGVTFEGEVEEAPDCRLAVLRDPEGNRVQLVEPRDGVVTGHWPALSHAIVNAAHFASTVHFYRELLGLRVAGERDGWIAFDTGATRLAIHDRADADSLPLHAEQRIAFAFEDAEFDAWAEELRGRGVTFATAPMEADLGVQAEVEDADGWFVVLHGPEPQKPLEEELAEDFLDDDEPPAKTEMIRKPGESSGESTKKRLTVAKIARKESERAATKSFEAPRTRETERGGFAPPAGPRPGGFGGPRPGPPSGPRPGGSGGPRPGGPPRPGGFGGPRPGGPPGPGGPRPGGAPGPGGPRPGGPRPGGPRPGGPRPGGPPRSGGPPRGGSGGRDQ